MLISERDTLLNIVLAWKVAIFAWNWAMKPSNFKNHCMIVELPVVRIQKAFECLIVMCICPQAGTIFS